MSEERNRNRQGQGRKLTAVDHLLGDKPTDFQLKLLKLGRECNWDENDPGFAVPLVMDQVEHVLEVYPERIRQELEAISDRLALRWEAMQAALDAAAMQGTQAGKRVDDHLTRTRDLIDLELAQLRQLLLDERLAMQAAVDDQSQQVLDGLADERSAMMQAMAKERESMRRLLAKEREEATRQLVVLADKQKQVLEAHTKDLIAQAVTANQKRADQQVKHIVKGVRMKHFRETIAVALLAAISILVVGWLAGLFMGRLPQLTSQLELLSQHAGIQQRETGWLLEKANRAECFYGIKPQSDPQCQS